MVISNVWELFISLCTLLLLFWIIKDVSKTLLYSYIREKENLEYDFESIKKRQRRYRYDDNILENDE